MTVYRTVTRVVDTGDLSRITDPTRFLIEFGEVEAALLDEEFPDRDGLTPRLTLADIPHRTMTVPVAEGYAFYGLFPETYAESARRFWEELRPPEVAVIGLRGIGTSLSTVVQTTLEECGVSVHRFTVRPHGHPFDRELRITDALAERWRTLGHAHFAIVDEGPGLSGSSFCGAARKLSQLGVPDERIVLFPSWDGDPDAFRSEDARRRWRRHRVYTTEFQGKPGWTDVSAGRWRELFYKDEADYPETVPHHEARKYLDGPMMRKFAGLGPYGDSKLKRARLLADAGFAPAVDGLDGGFIKSEFLSGAGLQPARSRIAEYLAFRYKHFTTGEATQPERLLELMHLSPPLPESALEVIVDGRLQKHEWISGVKTDALDHGDNHFFPGPTDIAWDLAGARIELGLDVTDEYVRLSGDSGVPRRLPFYTAAYKAFHLSYAKMFGLSTERYE